MKLIEKLKEIAYNDEKEKILDEFMYLRQTGSFLNLLEHAIDEINDNDIKKSFTSLQELVMKKNQEIMNREV